MSSGSLGGMFSATAQQIFGEATEAGKVMVPALRQTAFQTGDFFEIANRRFHFKDTAAAISFQRALAQLYA